MKDYVLVISAVVAGVFAIASALIAWTLKNSSYNQRDQLSHAKEKYEEAKSLYTTTFKLFEESIRQVLNRQQFILSQAFSENNAKIHLLAPQNVIEQYSEAASLLKSWSILYAKASPKQIKIGDQTATIIQAPDPAVKYKEPAELEYKKMQDSLQKLVDIMRSQLDNHA
jgi:hypothetical protein